MITELEITLDTTTDDIAQIAYDNATAVLTLVNTAEERLHVLQYLIQALTSDRDDAKEEALEDLISLAEDAEEEEQLPGQMSVNDYILAELDSDEYLLENHIEKTPLQRADEMMQRADELLYIAETETPIERRKRLRNEYRLAHPEMYASYDSSDDSTVE